MSTEISMSQLTSAQVSLKACAIGFYCTKQSYSRCDMMMMRIRP